MTTPSLKFFGAATAKPPVRAENIIHHYPDKKTGQAASTESGMSGVF
jgi:hypothetical protein